MVDFETIESDEKKFGTNNFIEVALKKAIAEDSENTFVAVSRGFVDMQGNRRYKKSIAIPMNKDLIEFVAKKIKEMGKDAPKAAKKVDEEAEEEVEEETEEE